MLRITADKTFLKQIPTNPGCYLYKDKSGEIIYIGKAINLLNRVSSYFAKENQLDPKTRIMLKHAVSLDFITVDSEVEALILETNLIKKYHPRYNRRMMDDKNYIWVMFDDRSDFPRPVIVREKKLKNATYFGPYPQAFPAHQVLKRLRRLFPYCNTNFRVKIVEQSGRSVRIGAEPRPCLDYHIGLCSGVCAGIISRAEHRKNISNIKRFFRGEKKDIYKDLEKRMRTLSADKEFEKAARVRDLLSNLNYITQRIKIDSGVDESKLRDKKSTINLRSVIELKNKLNISSRKSKNFRVECYDISNIQGKHATGSMVVFTGGRSDRNAYRKFKIKTKSTPDDFAMMQEVFRRRFKRINEEKFGARPGLIIVDGGKGQLSSASEILSRLNLKNIPIVGLAKKEEEIFVPKNDGFKKVILPRRSDSLYLVQRIRDEAHRFAIGYHRILRQNKSTISVLDDIPGVGEIIKRRLICAFGSTENIKKAKIAEIQTVVKNRKTAEAIKKLL